MNVSDSKKPLGVFLAALLTSLLTTAFAIGQPLPPPPPAAQPVPAVTPAPPLKPKPKPKIAKPKPKPVAPAATTPAPPAATQRPAGPLSLDAAPPRPPANVNNNSALPPPPVAQSTAPLSPTAARFDVRQRALAERVSAYLTNMRTLVGEFKQVAPDGSRTQGDFYLLKPGKLRFDYNPPSPVELVADGKSVAVRDRNLASQDLYPISQTPLRFLLADRIDLLRDTNLVGVYGDEIFVTVVIEEKQIVRGTYRLMLMFGAKDLQLKQWTVTDPQGADTTVAVFNLDTKSQPDPGMFRIDYTRYVR